MHSLSSAFIPQLKSSFKNSCMALLGISDGPQMPTNRMEDIRQLMLKELGEFGETKFPSAARRVRYARDIQGLWYARSDVMAILATTYGETVAREKVAYISRKFKGLLPDSLTNKGAFRARWPKSRL